MTYTEQEISNIVAAQRKYFLTGATLPVKWRIQQLKKLKEAVIAHEAEFEEALAKDLGRSKVEAYLCDVGPIIVEINEMIPSDNKLLNEFIYAQPLTQRIRQVSGVSD